MGARDARPVQPAIGSAESVVRRFAGTRVLVVGDAVLDRWMYGDTTRLCREAPLPVVELDREELAPGGAANCAANAAALGADVKYVGIVGDDRAGDTLARLLTERGVDARLVRDPDGSTVTKGRLVCADQVVARFDSGAGEWSNTALESLRSTFAAAAPDADVVVIADYGRALADPFPEFVGSVRHSIRGPLVIDGHRFGRWSVSRPTAITPSFAEAGTLFDLPADHARAVAALERRGDELVTRAGAESVVVTLDAAGTVLVRRGQPAHRTRPADGGGRHTCGAGDTFTTVLALALAAGGDPAVAADLGQAAADVVVQQPGTGCCTSAQLMARLASYPGVIRDHDVLAGLVAEHRAAGRRIVFTNGCFDVLHLGHVEYLREAARLGDVLIVAVNSDDSVTRLKGPGRPVVRADERASLLAALEMVDLVTVFDDATPRDLIERLRPDLYVKGGDYTAQMLSETEVMHAIGGEVVTVGYLPSHSTTELVDRIRSGARPEQHADAGRR